MIQSVYNDRTQQVYIAIKGIFDYARHTEFQSAYARFSEPKVDYVIDLEQTEFLDSSALGMLLLLKGYAETLESEVYLLNPNNRVMKSLETAHFNDLFKIHLPA